MKVLSNEILKRFPEIKSAVFEGDEELPYLMMDHLADWVVGQGEGKLDPIVVNRVLDFYNWCISQPNGKTAEDDILTIWTVGFYEKMFENEVMHPLIPKVVNKQEFVENRKCLISWVGQEA